MKTSSPLVGFLEGIVYGKAIGGWAGDPDTPTNRSIKVTALLDGKEVADTLADRDRKDTLYGSFLIPFTDPLVWQYVLENRLTVEVARTGEDPVPLRFLPNVTKQAEVLKQKFGPPAKPAEVAQPAKPVEPGPAARSEPGPGELSFVRLPVGTLSRDGVAIIGRNGFLFGNRDAAQLLGQYQIAPDEELVQRDAARWFVLLRSREALFKKREIAFLQVILPEKASILHDLAPEIFAHVTARLGVLEAVFEAEAKTEGAEPVTCYRSLLPALRSCHLAGLPPYLRTGSGLGTAGTQLVFYQIAQKMAALLPDHADAFAVIADLSGNLAPGKESDPLTGNLGRTFDLPIYETELLPDVGKAAAHGTGDANVIDRRESGSRFIWRNPKAATPLKVMAFSADGMGRGGGPGHLAWWFKAMFGEFHLVETAEIDETYVDQHRPDIVIAISREQALPNPPAR